MMSGSENDGDKTESRKDSFFSMAKPHNCGRRISERREQASQLRANRRKHIMIKIDVCQHVKESHRKEKPKSQW